MPGNEPEQLHAWSITLRIVAPYAIVGALQFLLINRYIAKIRRDEDDLRESEQR